MEDEEYDLNYGEGEGEILKLIKGEIVMLTFSLAFSR